MDSTAIKQRLNEAASRVQVEIDRELAAMRQEFGPDVCVGFDKSWTKGMDKCEFTARIETDVPWNDVDD
jgi:hypothetical protein